MKAPIVRSRTVALSKSLAPAATFLAAAAAVYLVGALLLGGWPMWAMMARMMGPLPVASYAAGILVAAAVAVAAVAALAGRGARSASAGAAALRCPECRAPVEADYVLCPECETPLEAACADCRRPLKASWRRCPYCGAAGSPGAHNVVALRPRDREAARS
jgi:RNA polymerase subunit RPABC4/transcription elongation factor Spt4